MKIRTEQLEQMSRAKRDRSSQRLLAELRQSSPAATAHRRDDDLLAVIEEATMKAHGYGIKSSEATTTFVKIAVFAGIFFDEHPTIRRYLEAPELDPDYKVTLLAELVAKQVKASL